MVLVYNVLYVVYTVCDERVKTEEAKQETFIADC